MAKGDLELVSIPAMATEESRFQLSDDPERVHIRHAGKVLSAREPREILEEIRRRQGSLTFSAQYQQAPVPPEGNVIRRAWLRTYSEPPSPFDYIVASWDTASTLNDSSDFSVSTVWGAKGLDFYLLDLLRGRFEVPDLRREIVRLPEQWRVDQTVIEETELGRAIVQDLRRSGDWRPILQKPRIDKETRFVAQSARFESGQVYIPAEAPSLAAWLDELLAFPNGRHDDQVDSTSQALHHLTARVHPFHLPQEPFQRPQKGSRPQSSQRRVEATA